MLGLNHRLNAAAEYLVTQLTVRVLRLHRSKIVLFDHLVGAGEQRRWKW
jgi:hypothetical protein